MITPPLIEIAEEESLPIYLWNHRFFDTQRKWTTEKANQSLKKMKAGDIVLLHDRQKPQKIDTFLQTLEYYIEKIQTRGLKSSCIK